MIRVGAIIARLVASFTLTAPQTEAVRSVGQSIIVSAAAGSGKTAVLAQRCAYLVCDAPPEQRCDVDRLLVVTFTDAAAAEMRTRIADALRERLALRPDDRRLRDQVGLVGAAHISTIHSFCLYVIRHWFSELGIDPTSTLLDADEAGVLKRDVLTQCFAEMYGAVEAGGDGLLGHPDETPPEQVASEAAPAARFARLVEHYGLGEDRGLVDFVLKLSDFVESLPDPDDWLRAARDRYANDARRELRAVASELARELAWQVEFSERLAGRIESDGGDFGAYAGPIREYADRAGEWAAMLGDTIDDGQGVSDDSALAILDKLRELIAAYKFPRAPTVKLPEDSPAELLAAKEAVKSLLAGVRGRLFQRRLKLRFGLFTMAERLADLESVAPDVATITQLVSTYRAAYAQRKRNLGVLDFADLESLALKVLRSPTGPNSTGSNSGGTESSAALTLRERFAYVLVDEFQDINPIQESIIRLASREPSSEDQDNLFVVGDVKQSIYRFRLAEPAIFTHRLDAFRRDGAAGRAITLGQNFRSRPEVIDAVNQLFGGLMREGLGGVTYDDDARLHHARTEERPDAQHGVELHLLDHMPSDHRGEDAPEEPDSAPLGVAELDNPARWSPIEREAFWIGRRIKQWVADQDCSLTGQPLAYRDVVILLRAAKVRAERMASVLSAMQVPAYADVGGSLLATREVRDILAVLHVLDNPQQDIPLAAVLRNGMLAERFCEDELVEIRSLDRTAPFHGCVRAYARSGPDDALKHRVQHTLDRIDAYRRAARRRPLADVLWSLYEQTGFFGYVGGLPNGAQRRANLLKLHDVTRKFGTFRRQGLYRFLRFVESMDADERSISVGAAMGETADVVRIMTIHQSKGLEFPVVFVAGLGTGFNLGDRSGQMIFDRDRGIGLRVADNEHLIEHPTLVHQRVADRIEQTAREEELRVLYVAMTRAREKLVLVGSRKGAPGFLDSARSQGTDQPPPLLEIATATTPLDWIVPAMASCFGGDADRSALNGSSVPPEVHCHNADEMATWRLQSERGTADRVTLEAVARGDPLPPDEPIDLDDPEVQRVRARLDFVYPHLGVTSIRAAIGVSEIKKTFDFTREDGERDHPQRNVSLDRGERDEAQRAAAKPPKPPKPPSDRCDRAVDTAAQRGIVTHLALQHLDFSVATDAPGVSAELDRLVAGGVLSAEQRDGVHDDSLAWFVATPLAARMREAGDAYRREFQFITTEPPSAFDASLPDDGDDQVLVRGIVDGILPVENELWIIDFKTDSVTFADAPTRAASYRVQMETYARTMSRLWRRPVVSTQLVFLVAQRTIELSGSADDSGAAFGDT